MDDLTTADYEDIIAALTIEQENKSVSDYTKDRYNAITDKIVKHLETLNDA